MERPNKRLEEILDKPPYEHVTQLKAFRDTTRYKLNIEPIWHKEW